MDVDLPFGTASEETRTATKRKDGVTKTKPYSVSKDQTPEPQASDVVVYPGLQLDLTAISLGGVTEKT